jgi:AraC family transcriptional regulator
MSFRSQTLECHRRSIQHVLDVMRRDPSAPLNLEAMAAAAYMSQFHFLRVFEEVTRVSPARFLAALRMHQAKRMLLETSLPVTDICFEAGYNSLGTFTRFFTDSIGVCPSSFRKLGKALAGRTVETLLRAYLQRQFAPRPGRSIVGTVRGQGDFHGAIFLGVFSSAIPQQRPISGGLLLDQGLFELALGENDRPPFLMAAGFPAHSNCINYLLPSAADVLVASTPLSTDVSGGPVLAHDLVLRPLGPFDPPILTALPILLEH